MTEITEEEFFYFIRISKKELYENRSTWQSATKHYCDLFVKYPNNKLFISWNMWAFLFREVWFVSRRMYLKSIWLTFLLLTMGMYTYSLTEILIDQLKVINPHIKTPNSWFSPPDGLFYWPSQSLRKLSSIPTDIYQFYHQLIALFPFLLCGLFGDYLYIKQVRKKIIKIKTKKNIAKYINPDQKKSINYLGGIIALCIFFIIDKKKEIRLGIYVCVGLIITMLPMSVVLLVVEMFEKLKIFCFWICKSIF